MLTHPGHPTPTKSPHLHVPSPSAPERVFVTGYQHSPGATPAVVHILAFEDEKTGGSANGSLVQLTPQQAVELGSHLRWLGLKLQEDV